MSSRPLSIRRIILITVIFLAVLAVIRLTWITALAPPDAPNIDHGVLDLRGSELIEQGAIHLNGEWELFPHQFLIPSGTGSAEPAATAPVYVPVPGDWASYMHPEGDSAIGYGSYRLRIRVDPDEERVYAIRMPSVNNSSEVFVNGQSVANIGHPDEDAASYTPGKLPYTASFTSNTGEIELIIQVANHYDRTDGGIEQSILFGQEPFVNKQVQISTGAQYAVSFLLLLHAVYSLILYFIGGRDRALLHFIFVNLLVIMTILTVDSKLLYQWVSLRWDWEIRLVHISYITSTLLLLRYTNHLLPGHIHPRVVTWHSYACAAYLLFVTAAPVSMLPEALFFNTVLIYIPLLLVPVLIFRALARGEADAIFLFLGAVALMNNMAWAALKNHGPFDFGYYPVDMALTYVLMACFWFKRYFNMFIQTSKLANKLQRIDKLKDHFLVNTSHELRNPLHGILTIAQTMLEQETNDKNKESLRLMVTVGTRMSLLLNDLLDISRLKENQIRLNPNPLHAQNVITGVLDMGRLMAAGKPVRFENRIPDQFPPVVADEDRLIQILFNLVHNAIKFTEEGVIAIDASVKEGMACFQVSDTGIGIDAELLPSIFDPYEQGPDDGFVDASGLGLGLNISKQLAELNGGTLTVVSTPGRGSTFTLTLPLADLDADTPEAHRAAASLLASSETASALADADPSLPQQEPSFSSGQPPVPSAAPDAPAAPSPAILLVDDDPINLQILIAALSSERFEMSTATSGKQALELLNTREWDLVIADVMMPHMSGYELSRAIRGRFSAAELPILLLTARSLPEDVQTGFRSGANDYVTKPVDATELKNRVRALTDLRQSIHEKLRMEAAWLQAQVQPHFLFNTLTSAMALSSLDTDRMRKLLDAFSEYLRASFSYKNVERLVPLEHELRLIKAYLYIEKERFEERLEVEWNIDPYLHQIAVPPLSIQTLIENAVRHGVMRRKAGGRVEIRIRQLDTSAEVSVIDNGVGIPTDKLELLLQHPAGPEGGIGLSNTNRRLLQLFGHPLQVRSVEGEGTTVSFLVPIR